MCRMWFKSRQVFPERIAEGFRLSMVGKVARFVSAAHVLTEAFTSVRIGVEECYSWRRMASGKCVQFVHLVLQNCQQSQERLLYNGIFHYMIL